LYDYIKLRAKIFVEMYILDTNHLKIYIHMIFFLHRSKPPPRSPPNQKSAAAADRFRHRTKTRRRRKSLSPPDKIRQPPQIPSAMPHKNLPSS
jgi:hypothetical protein